MSDLGDLTALLTDESKTLSDLDWLDVDEESYRDLEKLPKQNLDAIPDLEKQWKYLSDEDRYRLSPENREPSKPNTPFWSEREISNDLTDEKKSEIVEKFFRRHLQAGVRAKKAVTLLRQHFDSRALNAAKSRIKEALAERGLIGNVYIDASLFPNCDQGNGQDKVARQNKDAKYVLAKSKCSGCVWNKGGKCSRFQKEIVFDVQDIPYEDGLWDFYKAKAEALGKDLSGIDPKLSTKEKIRTASLASQVDPVQPLDSKPVQKSADISHGQAVSELESAEIRREVIENAYRTEKIRRVAHKMMQGNHGPEIRDILAADPDLAPLKSELHLLGNLYADLSYFETEKVAAEFLGGRDNLFIFGQTDDSKGGSKLANTGSFDLKDPRVLNQIVHRYALVQYGPDYMDKKGSVLERLATRLSGYEDDRFHKFTQNVYAQPLPEKTRRYEHLAPSIYDPTKGVTSEQAREKLHKAEVSREKVENQYRPEMERKLALRMLKGDHSKAMETRLATEGFEELQKHLHLLGKMYVLSSYVDEETLGELSNKNPKLASIPYLDSEELDQFFSKKETKARILTRYAQVQGLDASGNSRKVIASLHNQFKAMDATELQKMAQMVFSRPLFKKTAQYEAQGQHHDPTGGISTEDAAKTLQASTVSREKVGTTNSAVTARNSVARRMMAGDHGPAVQAMIQTDPSLKSLRPHLHLLGRLYKASFMFASDDQAGEFQKRNAHLYDLPEMKDVKAFFQSEDTQRAILRRAALASGLDPETKRAEFNSFVESRLSKFEGLTASKIIQAARSVFAKPLPERVRDYQGKVYSTTQAKSARASVSEEERKAYTSKLADKKPQTVRRDLRFYLKKEGGRNLLALLTQRYGIDTVKSLWLGKNRSAAANSLQDHTRKEKAEKAVVASVTDPNFEPVGQRVILPEFFETRIGRWLRDRLLAGSTGSKLSSEIRQTYSAEAIVENAPIILAMREEEGLLGRTYSMADSFDDCNTGKRAMNETVTQIVNGSKCSGCIYNKQARCLLYGKDLVSSPQFDDSTIQKALSYRVRSGGLSKGDVSEILGLDLDAKEKTRHAYRASSSNTTRVSDSQTTAHHGTNIDTAKAEKKVGEMLQTARKWLVAGNSEIDVRSALQKEYGDQVVKMGNVYLDQVIERTRDHISGMVDERNVHAASGLEQMEDMELTTARVHDPLEDINFDQNKKEQPVEGITFGGFTNME